MRSREWIIRRWIGRQFRVEKSLWNTHFYSVRAERTALVPIAGTNLKARACPSFGYF